MTTISFWEIHSYDFRDTYLLWDDNFLLGLWIWAQEGVKEKISKILTLHLS